MTLPLAIITWPLGVIFDPILTLSCCPCECCYLLLFQIPFNTLIILASIVFGLIFLVVAVIVGGIATLFGLVLAGVLLVLGIITWFVGLIAIYAALPLLIPLVFELLVIMFFGPLLFYFVWYWISNSLGI